MQLKNNAKLIYFSFSIIISVILVKYSPENTIF